MSPDLTMFTAVLAISWLTVTAGRFYFTTAREHERVRRDMIEAMAVVREQMDELSRYVVSEIPTHRSYRLNETPPERATSAPYRLAEP